MSLKAFVVVIFVSLLAFTAEAQEQRSNRAFVAEPIDKTIALAGEPQGQTALTLSELVAQALENNPEIQAAKKKVESARARAGQATYLEDPEVNFEAWGVPLNQPVNYRKANPLIFGVRQKLPFFGKLGLKGEMPAKKSGWSRRSLGPRNKRSSPKLSRPTPTTLWRARTWRSIRSFWSWFVIPARPPRDCTEVGRAPQQDVIKALLERTELLNKLTWAEKELTTSQAKLNTLLSRPPSSPSRPAGRTRVSSG